MNIAWGAISSIGFDVYMVLLERYAPSHLVNHSARLRRGQLMFKLSSGLHTLQLTDERCSRREHRQPRLPP